MTAISRLQIGTNASSKLVLALLLMVPFLAVGATWSEKPTNGYVMKLVSTALTLMLLLCALAANAEELVTLKTRKGIDQKFILIKPDQPEASVILFAGGKGALNLSSNFGTPEIKWGKKNFMVRTREMFAKHGFLVAVVDAPSDQKSNTGMLGGFRNSMDHIEDIDHVISFLRRQADVPVWLIGTSRGTESAANIAINSKQHPVGLVLTSSMSVSDPEGTPVPVTDMDLKRITIPTLVVASSDDECSKTPPQGADEIARMLSSSRKVEIKMFNGGDAPISDPCEALSYHGFLGIEEKVVEYISSYIKSN
jgi:pimeloyl-ACP methyl ester carboxylesterase